MKKILAVLAGILALNTLASASIPVTTKSDWVSADGIDTFHADQGGGGTWTETVQGVPQFHFRQIERTDAYVALYDDDRGVTVWLYSNAYYIKILGDNAPRFFRDGHWDDRRLFSYRLSDGTLNYFNLYPGKKWRWARASGFISDALETLRNEDEIQVYDAVTHHTFSLLDTQVWAKPDGGTWYKLADGNWS